MNKLYYLLPVVALSFASCTNQPVNTAEAKTTTAFNADSAARADTLKRMLMPNMRGFNFIDKQGRKQGYWVVYNKFAHLPGYANNDKVEEGHYTDGKKEGTWLQFKPGNHLKSQAEYKDDSLVKVTTVADSSHANK